MCHCDTLFALCSEAPDLILTNGKIVTVDSAFSIAEAVAIRGDRFVAVGTGDVVRRLAGLATKVIDLRGRTVIPGLIDGHLHNAGGGPGVSLSEVRSMAELLAAVEARVKVSKPDILTIPEKEIEALKPVATMVGGRFVYSDPAVRLE